MTPQYREIEEIERTITDMNVREAFSLGVYNLSQYIHYWSTRPKFEREAT